MPAKRVIFKNKRLIQAMNLSLSKIKKPDFILKKYDSMVLEKAFKQVEKQLIMHDRKIDDLTDAELETLVAVQKQEIHAKYKNRSLYALLAFLGFNAL